jgi:hypothetical protein
MAQSSRRPRRGMAGCVRRPHGRGGWLGLETTRYESPIAIWGWKASDTKKASRAKKVAVAFRGRLGQKSAAHKCSNRIRERDDILGQRSVDPRSRDRLSKKTMGQPGISYGVSEHRRPRRGTQQSTGVIERASGWADKGLKFPAMAVALCSSRHGRGR